MKIYVVYWVDLDNDCLKKSEVKILAVFSELKKAEKLRDTYDHKGYSGDIRCYYTRIEERTIDEVGVEVFRDLNEMGHEYEFSDDEVLLTEEDEDSEGDEDDEEEEEETPEKREADTPMKTETREPIKMEDLTEENIDEYTICRDCKRIVHKSEEPLVGNYETIQTEHCSNSTIVSVCRECSERENKRMRSIFARSRLEGFKQKLFENK